MKHTRILATTAAAVLLTGTLSAGLPVRAANPIVQTAYTADGAPLVYNDTFYLFTGHDEGNSGFFKMNNWRCYATTDMQNWTDLGSPLAYTDFAWASGEAWAGQVVERDGKFYYYVTVTAKAGGRAIGVAVADRPEGPYKDAIGKPLCGPMDGMKCIDPTVFVDDDGQAYLYFGNGSMWYARLADDMVSLKGELVSVNTKDGSFGGFYDEAPYLYKHNGLYYFIYAADALPQNVSYSTSNSPTGPWKYGGVIMHYQGNNCGTNHPGIADYKGKTYLTYHGGFLEGGGDFARSEAVEEVVWSGTKIPEIKRTTTGCTQLADLDPYQRVEAETICWAEGVQTEACNAGGQNTCDLQNGESIKVSGVGFGEGATTFSVSASSANQGGTLELHLDSKTGTLIGSCAIAGTGGWQNWQEFSCTVAGATGTHDLYLTFSGSGTNPLFNLDYWQFDGAGAGTVNKRLIQNLTVQDSENKADWSVYQKFAVGATLFGDRAFTAETVPARLQGAEAIRTACDSKTELGNLATFQTGEACIVFVAMDTRVTANAPEWLDTWRKTGDVLKTSNGLSLECFCKSFAAEETVTLGTNGGSSESVNYIVLAVPNHTVAGDLDANGSCEMRDLILLQKLLLGETVEIADWLAGDMDEDGALSAKDLTRLKRLLLDN